MCNILYLPYFGDIIGLIILSTLSQGSMWMVGSVFLPFFQPTEKKRVKYMDKLSNFTIFENIKNISKCYYCVPGSVQEAGETVMKIYTFPSGSLYSNGKDKLANNCNTHYVIYYVHTLSHL